MPYWLNDSPFESQLVMASPPGTSLVGFGGFSNGHLYYYWCSRVFRPGDYHFHLTEVPTLWVHLYAYLLPFGGTGNFSSSMTLLHHINLCCWYLVPSGVYPHMTWEGSHLVWISLWLVAIG